MNDQCRECDAKCCRYFSFEIEKPRSYEDFEDIRWFLMHEGISVHVDEGDWYISIENACKALGPGNRCDAYEDRPLICRNYNVHDCDQTEGKYGYEALFRTPEELEEHARKALGERQYECAKAAARAKAGGKAGETKRKMPMSNRH